MRAAVEGLGTPYPLGSLMPAIYQEDPFTMRWTAALDEVLAPVISTLDCLGAYIDPDLAPEDFLLWLSGWFGLSGVFDENWPLRRRREAVARSVALYRLRGTAEGVRGLLELAAGVRVEVLDSGGTSWSPVPGGALPGAAHARMTVRILAEPGDLGDAEALGDLIAAAKPAHVAHEVEMVVRR
ncbi:phage tail protein [Actinocrinis sp.]|uniref:phage tail protein n=1 Tax=Actinocrinis sp. TaxID=1920516 RepID=UPI002D462E7C|nr:phage tail protein [Actinocrinis sp.]HZP49721.1 phage tail protein [Actinocrinis sp.]